MYKTDTIAAISTAMSNSGIGIIRISGEDAFIIADKIFKPFKGSRKIEDAVSHTIHYGYIMDKGKVVDEVLLMVMKSPNTYTMENVVEINSHGGILVMQKILRLILESGARCAEPGEFTKRAFLNGRIDLSQAEAVINVINAKNDMALDMSVNQLKGSISKKVVDIREKILHEIAYIEAALDDPEHYNMEDYGIELKPKLIEIREELQNLLDTADNGRIVTEGIKTVILGKPNVGKSSLMNSLLGEDRAIVTDIAGTTRDILEENIRINGISLNIIDTAGIRDTEDIVEKIGVDRAKNLASTADLIIMVLDSSVPIDDDDREIINIIENKKAIILLNKSDLDMVTSVDNVKEIADNFSNGQDKNIITVSIKENKGIDILTEAVKDMFYTGDISYNDEVYLTSERHKSAISDSINSLNCVIDSIESGMPEDFFTIDLMNAYETMGTIIGEQVGDDLVNEIFSKFCMGK
ncbi:MAG: tRNA uridine-5-carboxymethylaminomethyl(34) synthesis GTPase MnmE [Lachnospiraceae bacterium]|nr:tRNA uridine-5-carboxymethylaminomethyl(34) synthesis GTPase MnmE [Lachnospiraceae bacterium]